MVYLVQSGIDGNKKTLPKQGCFLLCSIYGLILAACSALNASYAWRTSGVQAALAMSFTFYLLTVL